MLLLFLLLLLLLLTLFLFLLLLLLLFILLLFAFLLILLLFLLLLIIQCIGRSSARRLWVLNGPLSRTRLDVIASLPAVIMKVILADRRPAANNTRRSQMDLTSLRAIAPHAQRNVRIQQLLINVARASGASTRTQIQRGRTSPLLLGRLGM